MHVFQLVTTCLLEQNKLIAPKQYIDIYFGIHQNDMIRTSKILTKYFSKRFVSNTGFFHNKFVIMICDLGHALDIFTLGSHDVLILVNYKSKVALKMNN
jgi:hypothetical protein